MYDDINVFKEKDIVYLSIYIYDKYKIVFCYITGIVGSCTYNITIYIRMGGFIPIE